VSAPRLGAAPLVPTRRSIAPIEAQHRPPATINTRTVVAVRQPPKAAPSFVEQTKLMEKNPGRPLAPTQIATIRRPTAPDVQVRSANEPVRPGVTLKPARPAIATTPAAPKPVARPGFVATPTPRPTPSVPRPPVAEPTRGPATATRVPQPPPRPTISSAPAPNRNLAQQYQQQRDQMENRHAQESANPPANTTPQALAKQQATEHRALDNNYVQARANNARSMPAAPPPRPPQPEAARPAPAAPPRPAPEPRPAAPQPRPAAPQPRPAPQPRKP